MTESTDFDGSNTALWNDRVMLMSSKGYIGTAVALAFIGVFGFTFNLFVVLLMWKDKQLWSPLNIVLFNLVCSDLSVSILGNPWTLASAMSQEWIFGDTMCKAYGFFMSLLGITSIATLTVMSFERYIMVSRPFRNVHLTRELAIASVLGIWVYSLSLTMPPLLVWGAYVNEAANISCSINWEDKNYASMTYIVFLFVFGLAIPVVVIGFSYTNIIITMKQSTMRSGRVTKAERRVTVMIFVMIVAFLVAWTPYAAMALIIQFGDASAVTPAMAVIPALVAKSSICYNPVIYVGMNVQFRQSWSRVFGRNLKTEDKSGKSTFTNLSEFPMKSFSKDTKNISHEVETRYKLAETSKFDAITSDCL